MMNNYVYITQILPLTLSVAWSILASEIHDISETETITSSGERGGGPLEIANLGHCSHTPTVSYMYLKTEAQIAAETLWLFISLELNFFFELYFKSSKFLTEKKTLRLLLISQLVNALRGNNCCHF
jgi:hypothetical protein